MTIKEVLSVAIWFRYLQNIFSFELLQITLNASCKLCEFLTDVSGNWARLSGMHMYISCHSFAAIQIQNSWDTVTLKKKQLCTDIWLNIFYIKNDDVYSCSLYRIYWILLIWILVFKLYQVQHFKDNIFHFIIADQLRSWFSILFSHVISVQGLLDLKLFDFNKFLDLSM